MSTNVVNTNAGQNAIQQRRQNCINFEGKPKLNLYERTKLDYDCCYIDQQYHLNFQPLNLKRPVLEVV